MRLVIVSLLDVYSCDQSLALLSLHSLYLHCESNAVIEANSGCSIMFTCVMLFFSMAAALLYIYWIKCISSACIVSFCPMALPGTNYEGFE